MMGITPISIGVNNNGYSYSARHRANHMDHGIGFIPLGNRDRVKNIFIYGVEEFQEEGSVDISTSKRR